jgi:hypothetical protein
MVWKGIQNAIRRVPPCPNYCIARSGKFIRSR